VATPSCPARALRSTRCAAVGAALAIAGCGGGHHRPAPAPTVTATPRPPTAADLIGRALQRRARRVPRRLGLRHPRYVVEGVAVHGRRARVHARLSYGIRAVAGDFGADRRLLARRRGGHWRISRSLGGRDAEPWEVDDYVRVRTPHFVVLTPPDIPAPVDALEAGYRRLEALLARRRLKRRYLAVVARDPAHARRITKHIAGLESLTALTDTETRITGPAQRVTQIGSQRLIIVASAFALAGADEQQTVVAHELTHAALAPITSGRVPSWLVEGIALYVSDDDRRAEYTALPTVPTLAALSAPDAIARLKGEAQRAAYATASAAAFAVAYRYGHAGLLRLYRAYDDPTLHGSAGDPRLTDRALRRTLHTSLTAVQRTLG
jgi:hypothetical protein